MRTFKVHAAEQVFLYVFREIILLQWLISPIYTLYLVDKLAKTFEESLALRDFPPGSYMTRRERPFLDKLLPVESCVRSSFDSLFFSCSVSFQR